MATPRCEGQLKGQPRIIKSNRKNRIKEVDNDSGLDYYLTILLKQF